MKERHPWPLGVHYHHINPLDYHPLRFCGRICCSSTWRAVSDESSELRGSLISSHPKMTGSWRYSTLVMLFTLVNTVCNHNNNWRIRSFTLDAEISQAPKDRSMTMIFCLQNPSTHCNSTLRILACIITVWSLQCFESLISSPGSCEISQQLAIPSNLGWSPAM